MNTEPVQKDKVPGLRFRDFFILTTLVAVVCAAIWHVSPLGIGFANGPTNPLIRKFAVAVYGLSYFVGIPVLVIGQVLSAILAVLGRRRYAFIVPLASIGAFLLSVVIVLLLFH